MIVIQPLSVCSAGSGIEGASTPACRTKMHPSIESRLAVIREECMPEDATYWLGGSPDSSKAFGPQHEAAALSKLVAWQKEKQPKAEEDVVRLCDAYCERVGAHQQAGPSGRPVPDPSPEAALLSWCKAKGMVASVSPAVFGDLRGVAADTAMRPGDEMVSLPTSCLISYDTAMTSDLGPVLKRIPGLDAESAAVIWTMIDRHDAESPWAPFWAALPSAFDTGLGVEDARLQHSLAGVPWLLQEAVHARQHLKEQYEALLPVLDALVRAYPQHIKPVHVTYSSYLWAVELWYAYAIQVQLPGAKAPVTCLVPYISLINHSPWPHAVHFSRVDPSTHMLKVRCFRSVEAGAQAYLSYGPLPNAKLLLFYGFAVPSNPYDELPLMLPAEGLEQVGAPKQLNTWLHAAISSAAALGTSHRLRAWGPIPPSLLTAARLLVASQAELGGLDLHPPAAAAASSGASNVDTGRAGKATGSKGKQGKSRSDKSKSVAGAGSDPLVAKVAQAARKLGGKALGKDTEAAALRLIMSVVEAACVGLPAAGSAGGVDAIVAASGEGGAGFEQAASLVVKGMRAVREHVLAECTRLLEACTDSV